MKYLTALLASFAYGWMLGIKAGNLPSEIITAIIGVLSLGGAHGTVMLLNKNSTNRQTFADTAADVTSDPAIILLFTLGLAVGVTLGMIALNHWSCLIPPKH